MKILLIGNGAREHIMAEKLASSPKCDELIVYASAVNPGIKKLASVYRLGSLSDIEELSEFAEEKKPDFAVVGPENPIADGAVDTLNKIGIPCASPTKACGQLESSKAFTRDLLKKYNIPGNPEFQNFTSEEGMLDFAKKLGEIVIKADGLHGGKGVLVQGDHFETIEEGVEHAKKFLETDPYVVIEEKFVGQEFSLMSFVDGEHVIDMPPIQDHKRALEGDKGPNTGGMGTYNYPGNLPFLTDKDVADAHDITVQVARAIKEELGEAFKGIMYGGFIATKNGVRLIEYNARFGDPEAMNALTLLETDYVDICLATINGTLNELDIKFTPKATVCKYAVPEGYPTNPTKGEEVIIKEMPEGVKVYMASINELEGRLIMGGSRTAAVVSMADTIEKAEQLAEEGVLAIKGPVFHRKDIGTHSLIQKRIDMMNKIRG